MFVLLTAATVTVREVSNSPLRAERTGAPEVAIPVSTVWLSVPLCDDVNELFTANRVAPKQREGGNGPSATNDVSLGVRKISQLAKDDGMLLKGDLR